MTLFQQGAFNLHSGESSKWKIECDALTLKDWRTLALMIVEHAEPFRAVVGVPRGGLPLAKALQPFATSGPVLIVDDVLTTGNSILKVMHAHNLGEPLQAWVVFARGPCPSGINALFQMPGSH